MSGHRSALQRLFVLLTCSIIALLAGCNDDDALQAPTGLSYGMTSATYQVGTAIVANRPSASGGAIDRYTVSPSLPVGLALDAVTGVISGTPTVVSPSTVYTVTAQNTAGSATARVQIEVRSAAAAPATLSYREATVTYTVGQAIAANTAASSGGPIITHSITPALPAGLALDAQTGTISGTPTAVTPATSYVVTGSNAAGSVTATLQITVQAVVVAPASLSYATASALYVTTEPITPNTPVTTGGAIASFTVAPALPTGLSLNTTTGVISGTPATIQSSITYTITGSNTAGSAQAQVQIVVTSRGTWSTVTAAPMPVPVHYFTATRLNDGRVLVAGGLGGGGYTAGAWIYDPVGNLWTPTGTMLTVRSGHTATLLADGKVLVAGGEFAIGNAVASAEIYDPVVGTWTAVGPMTDARANHTATLLANGKVLVAGGYSAPGGTLTFFGSMDLFDPVTNTWTRTASSLASPRTQHAAALLPDGNVLMIGGINLGGYVNTIERIAFDGSTTTTEPFPITGNITVATRLPDGTILASTDRTGTAQRYDPLTSTWTASTMLAQRSIPTITTLPDGRVLVAGGALTGGVRATSTEIYNPDTNTWTAGNPMAAGRNAAQAVVLADGSVLMLGGFDGGDVATVERFVP